MNIDNLIAELQAAWKPITKQDIEAIAAEVRKSPKMIALEKEIEQGRAFLRVLDRLGV